MLESIALDLAKALARRLGSTYDTRRDERALERAVAAALLQTRERHHAALARVGYDEVTSFLIREGADEIAKLMLTGRGADARTLAQGYATSLGQGDDRVGSALEVPFATLLEVLVRELGRHDPFAARLAAVASTRPLSAGEADERELLVWIVDRFSHVSTAGLGTSEHLQLPLGDVFSLPTATAQRPAGARWESRAEQQVAVLTERLRSGEVSHEEYEAQLGRLESAPAGDDPTPVDLARLLRESDRLVVLGEPGSGKTTLLRYLALRHARALLAGAAMVDAELGAARVPLYVRAGEFARSDERGAGLGAFIAPFLCGALGCPLVLERLRDVVATQLRAGTCLVLVDGLDEVGSAAERSIVVDAITSFVIAYEPRGNRIVCASRISGYAAAPLPSGFTAVRLSDMDDAGIERFLGLYVPALERVEAPSKSDAILERDAARTVQRLLEAFGSSAGVRRLAANPLLLTALLLVHRTHGSLPERRVDAYATIVEALGRSWRSHQGVPESRLPERERLMGWLARLAAWMHEHRPQGSVGPRDLLRVLGPAWAELQRERWDESVLDLADPESSAAGRALVAFARQVEEHSGLLVERAPRRWGFPHLTFEEYFAGRALVLLGRVRDRPARIRERLSDPRYEEPVLLGLGLVGRDFPEEIQPLFEAAVLGRGQEAEDLGLRPGDDEDLLGRDLRFAIGALADDVALAPALVDELLERALDDLLGERVGRGRFGLYRTDLLQRVKALRDAPAGERFAELVAHRLDPSSPVTGDDVWLLLSLAATCRPHARIVAAVTALSDHPNLDVLVRAARILATWNAVPPGVSANLAHVVVSTAGDFEVAGKAAEVLAAQDTLPDDVFVRLEQGIATPGFFGVAAHVPGFLAELAADVLAARHDVPADVRHRLREVVMHVDDLLPVAAAARVLAAQGSLTAAVRDRIESLVETAADARAVARAARVLERDGELPPAVRRRLAALAAAPGDALATVDLARTAAAHGPLPDAVSRRLAELIAETRNGSFASVIVGLYDRRAPAAVEYLDAVYEDMHISVAAVRAARVLAARHALPDDVTARLRALVAQPPDPSAAVLAAQVLAAIGAIDAGIEDDLARLAVPTPGGGSGRLAVTTPDGGSATDAAAILGARGALAPKVAVMLAGRVADDGHEQAASLLAAQRVLPADAVAPLTRAVSSGDAVRPAGMAATVLAAHGALPAGADERLVDLVVAAAQRWDASPAIDALVARPVLPAELQARLAAAARGGSAPAHEVIWRRAGQPVTGA